MPKIKLTYREAVEVFMVRVTGCVWEELEKGGTSLNFGKFFEVMRTAMKDDKFRKKAENLFIYWIRDQVVLDEMDEPKGYTEQIPSPDCINTGP